MKRFLETTALLIASLFLVVAGVDAALDHLSHSSSQNSFTIYSENGGVLLVYDGDLAGCKVCAKPGPVVAPGFLHRT